jgi:hypothetical protein
MIIIIITITNTITMTDGLIQLTRSEKYILSSVILIVGELLLHEEER